MKRVAQSGLWLILWLGSLAITLSSLVYFHFDERAPFVIEKLPLPAEGLYVFVLRLHVIAAALCLPGCLTLSSKIILKHFPKFHRHCGRMIGSLILLILVPTGFYLAFFARGGRAGTLGFLLTGAIVMVAMVEGIRAARARQYARHRRLVFHVLGQLSVAVTSRAMLFGFEAATQLDPDFAYVISLWIPVVGTFALVELLVSPINLKTIFRRLYEQTLPHLHPLRARRADIR